MFLQDAQHTDSHMIIPENPIYINYEDYNNEIIQGYLLS